MKLNNYYNLKDNLPNEIQDIVSQYWCWKKYFTNNVIYHLNYDLNNNDFIYNVIDYEDLDKVYYDHTYHHKLIHKRLYYYSKSCKYFLKNKNLILDLNEKIKYIFENKGLLKYYKYKYDWINFVDTSKSWYYKDFFPEEIKYYGFMMILLKRKLYYIHISHSLKNSFTCKKLMNDPNYIDMSLYLIY